MEAKVRLGLHVFAALGSLLALAWFILGFRGVWRELQDGFQLVDLKQMLLALFFFGMGAYFLVTGWFLWKKMSPNAIRLVAGVLALMIYAFVHPAISEAIMEGRENLHFFEEFSTRLAIFWINIAVAYGIYRSLAAMLIHASGAQHPNSSPQDPPSAPSPEPAPAPQPPNTTPGRPISPLGARILERKEAIAKKRENAEDPPSSS